MNKQRALLYLQSYPALIDQINRLIDLVQANDSTIQALVLFGSTARLTPHQDSDADVLVWVEDHQRFHDLTGDQSHGVYLLVAAEEAPANQERCEWPFIAVVSEGERDLSPDLLTNVAHEGVLLYQKHGAVLPSFLMRLQSYQHWQERVQALLAKCAHVTAAKPSRMPA